MIRAEYNHHQNECLKKWNRKAFFLEKISLKNIFNWSNGSISFFSPIVILTGKNGVGKSTCINALKYVYNIQMGKTDDGVISSIKSFQIVLENRKDQKIVIQNGKIIKEDFRLPNLIDLTFDTTLYSYFKQSSNQDREDYIKTLEQYDFDYLPPEELQILQFFIEKKIKLAERIVDLGDIEDNESEEIEPEYIPEEIEPEYISEEIEPEYIPEEIEPEYIPEEIEPEYIPEEIEPEYILEEIEPEYIPEDIEFENIEISENEKREYYRITLENGIIYDSYTMGSGEFFLNQFLWGLHDLPKGSIVIIEELENYLHSDVQKKIVELIHELAHKNYIQFILTTHSPTIIDHVLTNSLILVRYRDSNVSFIPNCPNWLAKDELGTTIQNKKIVLVEDEKARSFLRTIISYNCHSLLNQIEIINCKGDTEIETLMDSVNAVELKNFIGIVDGDCTNGKRLVIPHILKLPGNDVPEKIVVAAAKSNPKVLSDILMMNDADLIVSTIELATTRLDHHEWISKIAYDLGQTSDSLWDAMLKIWYHYNKEEAKAFFNLFYREFATN
jgi:AAA15 family ATPase/GTPase